MTVHHFFLRSEAIQFPLAKIGGQEHHHLSRVLRLKPGEKIRIFNEKGELFLAEVERIKPHETVIQIRERLEAENVAVALTVAQACLQGRLMDFLIPKMTELRIARFIPLVTRRTVVRLEGRTQSKVSRWRRLALEAAKQCQSSLVPEIHPPLTLRDFLLSRDERQRYYLSERGGIILRDALLADLTSEQGKRPDSAVICVGPEGGWEREEEELLENHGFQAISLGPRIFRAETALLAAASILTHFWNA